MSTTGGSRKRRRVSPDADSTDAHLETRTMSSARMPVHAHALEAIKTDSGITNGNEQGQHTHSEPCHHETSLRNLHTDLDSMRQLITCNVCHRFMYEPYALSCGHTYCYSCLAEWMGKNHKKSCPDCRSHVRQEPTPAFLIREMVLIFVNRTQLLPDGETSEEHRQMALEEAAILANDRADTDERQGGLFKGTFKRASARAITALHDTSDHVDRCPNCLHEVEDGWCLTCHVRVRASDADSDDSDDSSEMTEELDMDIDARDMTGESVGPWEMDERHLFGSSSEEEDSSEDDRDLSGFVEDEVRWESGADEPDYSFEAVEFDDTPDPQRTVPVPVSDVSSSEDDSDEMQPVRRRRLVNRRSAPSYARVPVTISSSSDEDEDEDDDEQGPRVPCNGRHFRERRIESDSEISTSAAPTDYDSEDTTRQHAVTAGFSPLQYDGDETTQSIEGGLSPSHSGNIPIHPGSTSPSDSGQSGESNPGGLSVDGESCSDDDEDGGSDDHRNGRGETASDDESDGSEQSTLIEPNALHRLENLVRRRPRFADPPRCNGVGLPFGTSQAPRPRVSRRSMLHIQLGNPSPNRVTEIRAPAHPFNLDSTLARISALNKERQVIDQGVHRTALESNTAHARNRQPAAIESLFTFPRDRHQSMARDEQDWRGVRTERGPRSAGASLSQPGGRRGLSTLMPHSSDSVSGSSRTARDDNHDTGTHPMGATDDSEDSTGW